MPASLSTASPAAATSAGADFSRIGNSLYAWCREHHAVGDVLTQDQLLEPDIIPDKDLTILLGAAQYLINTRLLKTHDTRGQGIAWEIISQDRAANYTDLNVDEQLVYGHIESAGAAGIWTKMLKLKTGGHVKNNDKACKSLESRGLIKQMKSVKHPSRKMYILAGLEPNEEATGGAWFTENELDTALMEEMGDVVEFFVAKDSWRELAVEPENTFVIDLATSSHKNKRKQPSDGFDQKGKGKLKASKLDDHRPRSESPDASSAKSRPKSLPTKFYEPFGANYTGYPTVKSLTSQIKRINVSHVLLPESAIAQLLEVMVYDNRLYKIQRIVNNGEQPTTMFKSVRTLKELQEVKKRQDKMRSEKNPQTRKAAFRAQELEDIGLGGTTEVPCLQCPVLHLCEETGPVSVETCEYFDEWFKKIDMADVEAEVHDPAPGDEKKPDIAL